MSAAPDEDDLHSLIDLVYQAAVDPDRWAQCLQQLGDVLRSARSALFIHNFDTRGIEADAPGLLFHTAGFDEASLVSYASHYSSVNVWTANEERLAAGRVVNSAMLYPNDQLPRSEFYGDWLRPQGVFYVLGGIVAREGALAAKLTLLRPRALGEYDVDEMAFLQRLYPHVRRACELNQRLTRQQADAAMGRLALQASPLCIFALGVQGQLLHANAQAESALRRGVLTLRHGHLSASAARHRAALRHALRRVVDEGVPSHLNLDGDTGAGHCLTLMRMPPGERFAMHGTRAEVLGVMGDSNRRPLAVPEQLSALFGLSPAEARLARALAEGQSLDAFAQARQVSRNTVRTQLQHALGKTGTDSQRALIRLVLAVPAWAG